MAIHVSDKQNLPCLVLKGIFHVYIILSHNSHLIHTPLQCVITEHVLAHEFSELAEEMSLTDGDGELCLIEEEEGEHGHEEEEEEHGHEEEGEEHGHEGEGVGE